MKSKYFLLLFTLLSSTAIACTDVYLVDFAHKPAGAALWILPDERDVRLELPFQWKSANEKLTLLLFANRISKDEISLKFSRSTSVELAVFQTTLTSEINAIQPVNVIAKDGDTGDTWSVRLLPVCGSL